MTRLTERELIEEILAPLARSGDGSLGLTDDAAFIACEPGTDLVVTQDTLIGGIHFRADDPADLIARKAIRVNLSDLAAKGGEPLAYFLSLGMSDGLGREWAEAFARGLATDQSEYSIALYGGDTVRSPAGIVVTVTVCGRVPAGRMVRRSGAREGDAVYVSGTIGDGALGLLASAGNEPSLAHLEDEACAELADRFLLPRPRTGLAGVLREHASAAMDISDGLAGDLQLLTAASGVSAAVDIARVPLSVPAHAVVERDPALIEVVLTGGDDYEILCTVEAARERAFAAAAARTGIQMTRIGSVIAGTAPPVFRDEAGRAVTFKRASYRHF